MTTITTMRCDGEDLPVIGADLLVAANALLASRGRVFGVTYEELCEALDEAAEIDETRVRGVVTSMTCDGEDLPVADGDIVMLADQILRGRKKNPRTVSDDEYVDAIEQAAALMSARRAPNVVTAMQQPTRSKQVPTLESVPVTAYRVRVA